MCSIHVRKPICRFVGPAARDADAIATLLARILAPPPEKDPTNREIHPRGRIEHPVMRLCAHAPCLAGPIMYDNDYSRHPRSEGTPMKAGNITGYWPPCADETARTHGYRPVSECEAAIAAGTAGPCHSGESGLVDYGIVEWGDDDIVSINGKRTLSGYVFMLEDAIFGCPRLHLWKSDVSVQQGADTTVDGVWGAGDRPRGDRDHPLSIDQRYTRGCAQPQPDSHPRRRYRAPFPRDTVSLPLGPCQAPSSVRGGTRQAHQPAPVTADDGRIDRCRTLDAPVQCRYAIGCFRVCTTLALRRFSLLAFPNVTCPVSAFWKKCCNRHFFRK